MAYHPAGRGPHRGVLADHLPADRLRPAPGFAADIHPARFDFLPPHRHGWRLGHRAGPGIACTPVRGLPRGRGAEDRGHHRPTAHTGDPDRRHARHRSRHRVGCLDLLALGPWTVPWRDCTAFDDAPGDPCGGLRNARAVRADEPGHRAGTGLPRRGRGGPICGRHHHREGRHVATPIRRGHGIRPDGRCPTRPDDAGGSGRRGGDRRDLHAVHLGVPRSGRIDHRWTRVRADGRPPAAVRLDRSVRGVAAVRGVRTGRHPRPQPDPGDLGGMRDAHRPRGGLAQQCRAGGGHHAGGRRHRGRGGSMAPDRQT